MEINPGVTGNHFPGLILLGKRRSRALDGAAPFSQVRWKGRGGLVKVKDRKKFLRGNLSLGTQEQALDIGHGAGFSSGKEFLAKVKPLLVPGHEPGF